MGSSSDRQRLPARVPSAVDRVGWRDDGEAVTAIGAAKMPNSMYGFGLVEGSADAGFGPGCAWLTPTGQAVVDMLLGRISSKFPYDPI